MAAGLTMSSVRNIFDTVTSSCKAKPVNPVRASNSPPSDVSRTQLLDAVISGDVEKVASLAKSGVPLHDAKFSESSPMHVAAYHGHIDVMEKLLMSGCDLHARNSRGQTALHVACQEQHVAAACCLLRYGARHSDLDLTGVTPTDLTNRDALKRFLDLGVHCPPLPNFPQFAEIVLRAASAQGSSPDRQLVNCLPDFMHLYNIFLTVASLGGYALVQRQHMWPVVHNEVMGDGSGGTLESECALYETYISPVEAQLLNQCLPGTLPGGFVSSVAGGLSNMINNSRPLFSIAPGLVEVCLPVSPMTTLDCSRTQPQAPAANPLVMKKMQVQRANKTQTNTKVSKQSGISKDIYGNGNGAQTDMLSNGYNGNSSANGVNGCSNREGQNDYHLVDGKEPVNGFRIKKLSPNGKPASNVGSLFGWLQKKFNAAETGGSSGEKNVTNGHVDGNRSPLVNGLKAGNERSTLTAGDVNDEEPLVTDGEEMVNSAPQETSERMNISRTQADDCLFSFSSASSDDEFFGDNQAVSIKKSSSSRTAVRAVECDSGEEDLELPFLVAEPGPSTSCESASLSNSQAQANPSMLVETKPSASPSRVPHPESPSCIPAVASDSSSSSQKLTSDRGGGSPQRRNCSGLSYCEDAPSVQHNTGKSNGIFQQLATYIRASKPRQSIVQKTLQEESNARLEEGAKEPSAVTLADELSTPVDSVSVASSLADTADQDHLDAQTEEAGYFELSPRDLASPVDLLWGSESPHTAANGHEEQGHSETSSVAGQQSRSSFEYESTSPAWSVGSSAHLQWSEPTTPSGTWSELSSNDISAEQKPEEKRKKRGSVPRALACLESDLKVTPSRPVALPSSIPELYQDSRFLSRDQRKLQQQYLLLLSSDKPTPSKSRNDTISQRRKVGRPRGPASSSKNTPTCPSQHSENAPLTKRNSKTRFPTCITYTHRKRKRKVSEINQSEAESEAEGPITPTTDDRRKRSKKPSPFQDFIPKVLATRSRSGRNLEFSKADGVDGQNSQHQLSPTDHSQGGLRQLRSRHSTSASSSSSTFVFSRAPSECGSVEPILMNSAISDHQFNGFNNLESAGVRIEAESRTTFTTPRSDVTPSLSFNEHKADFEADSDPIITEEGDTPEEGLQPSSSTQVRLTRNGRVRQSPTSSSDVPENCKTQHKQDGSSTAAEDRALYHKYSVKVIKSQGDTALHKAARAGDTNACAVCLDFGVDINAADHAGWTALHEAIVGGSLDTAELLLIRGANANAGSSDGTRPLHDAAEVGCEAVRLLLRFGADPSIADYSGNLPCHHTDDVECLKLLQDAAEANLRNKRMEREQEMALTNDGTCNLIALVDTEHLKALEVSLQSDIRAMAKYLQLMAANVPRFYAGPVIEFSDEPIAPAYSLALAPWLMDRRFNFVLLEDVLTYLNVDLSTLNTEVPSFKWLSIGVRTFRRLAKGSLFVRCVSNLLPDWEEDEEVHLVLLTDFVRSLMDTDLELVDC